MGVELLYSADAASPFDYGRLPGHVQVVLGYVGESGETPHVWSTGEVADVRTAGLAWCPIVVPAQRALAAEDGTRAARVMLDALPQYGYGKGGPVFLDIERSSFDASTSGAAHAARTWRAGMAAGGYPDAYVYWPRSSSFTWLPAWTGTAPKRLPTGCVGVQYAGGVDGGRYDLSAWDPSVFASVTASPPGGIMMLSKADQVFLVDQLGKVQQNLADMIQALHVGKGGKHDWEANVGAVLREVRAIAKATTAGGLSNVDIGELADELAGKLGPALAGQLAAELSRRLAS